MAECGRGNPPPKTERGKKISAALKGKAKNSSHSKKISQALKGKAVSWGKKISEAMKNSPCVRAAAQKRSKSGGGGGTRSGAKKAAGNEKFRG